MIQRVVSALLMGAILAPGTPTMAQPSPGGQSMPQSQGVLASAERSASEVRLQQDETFVRRRRSGALAAMGGILAATGAVLLLRPPECTLVGDAQYERVDPFLNETIRATYSAVRVRDECDLRVLAEFIFHDFPEFNYQFAEYQSDRNLYTVPWDFDDRSVDSNRTMNRVGLAAIGAGGALLWFGLRQVEVPFRVDLGIGGGLAVSRSFGW